MSEHLLDQCLLCHSQGLRAWVIGKKGRSYWVCPFCQFVSLNAQHRLLPELEKKRYLQHNNDIHSPDYLSYVQSNLQKIEELSLRFLKAAKGGNENIHVLDFGCGRDPVLSRALETLGYPVTLYDYYFFNDNGYSDKSYDLILLIEVIEHLADPLAKMLELRRLLRPGGRILIRTEPLTFDEDFFKCWWYPGDKTHISFFSVYSMQVLASAIDLKVDSVQGHFFVLA